ncbi:hypothetical protein CRUP_035140, partial [Coryphaenoides rupestris]
GPPDPQAPAALPAPTVLMVPKGLLVVLVTLDRLERRESQVKADPRVLEESQERRARVESEARRERGGSREYRDQPEVGAGQEMMDQKETLCFITSGSRWFPLATPDPLESSDPE